MSCCKSCKKKSLYAWRSRNKDCLKQISRRYRQSERGRIKKKQWQASEKGKAYGKRKRHSEKYKAWRAEYERSAKVKEYRKLYKARPERRKRDLELSRTEHKRTLHRLHARKRLTLTKYKIHNAMSCRIRAIVNKKLVTWPRFLGYNVQDLISHLERQFDKNMSWSNFGRGLGKWNIDHIVPVSSFNIKEVGDAEFLACWSLANLRPCWAIENFRKSAKRVFLL